MADLDFVVNADPGDLGYSQRPKRRFAEDGLREGKYDCILEALGAGTVFVGGLEDVKAARNLQTAVRTRASRLLRAADEEKRLPIKVEHLTQGGESVFIWAGIHQKGDGFGVLFNLGQDPSLSGEVEEVLGDEPEPTETEEDEGVF